MQARVRDGTCQSRKFIVVPTAIGALPKTVSKSSEPKITQVAKMPSAKPKWPTRLTRKALIEASFADLRSYQKQIRSYERSPPPSQSKNSCTKSLAVANISLRKEKRLR